MGATCQMLRLGQFSRKDEFFVCDVFSRVHTKEHVSIFELGFSFW